MPLQKCSRKDCRSRNKTALWQVDGKGICGSCFEKLLESKAFDEMRIHRLSDRDSDFHAPSRPASRMAVI